MSATGSACGVELTSPMYTWLVSIAAVFPSVVIYADRLVVVVERQREGKKKKKVSMGLGFRAVKLIKHRLSQPSPLPNSVVWVCRWFRNEPSRNVTGRGVSRSQDNSLLSMDFNSDNVIFKHGRSFSAFSTKTAKLSLGPSRRKVTGAKLH